ncbi:MAG TPA: c-type cytochrome [Candidatus Brocadiales bacterium]|nr:c-type cytochrome [Candidatus Brocadiales bacterium]
MTVEESDKLDKLVSTGKGAWGKARCNLCHAQKGIGGQVTVAPDLGKVSTKVNRDWLYYWLKNHRDYFLNTMMTQFEMSDEELKSLIEYILRSKDFVPEEEEEEGKIEVTYSKDPTIIEKGKRVITISRRVICHDIEGIKEILPAVKREPAPAEGFAKVVYERRCLTWRANGKKVN